MTRAAGPTGRRVAGYWFGLFRDPLAVYDALRREYGDAVRLPMTPHRTFHLLSRPEHFEHVLVTHQERYVKAWTYKPLKAFLGEGLLTSEGETWQRHRRLVQPVFSHRHIQAFAPEIVAAARARAASWKPGATLDVAAEMRTLTMDVVGRVLFGTDLAGDAERVGHAVTRAQNAIMLSSLLAGVSSPQRLRAAMRFVPGVAGSAGTLDQLVDRMLDERIAAAHAEPRDLLDRLITGEPELTRDEIRDELLTLVLAGHETTANTLTWTLVLLSRYPATRERLVEEVDTVLGGRDAQAADLDALHWTRAVIDEAMRLYPPAWTIERDAVTDDDVAGVQVRARDTVAVSPWLLHRNPDVWPNPEGFDPSRFLPGASEGRPRYAFVPFGGGRRICVGAGLAQLEATLALATFAASHRLDLAPGSDVRAQAGVTLHPRGAVPMTTLPRVTAPVPVA